MPFAFIIVGIVMLVSGVRGKSANLLTLLKGDLTGSNNFVYWILSILVIGSLGYVDEFKTLSRALLGLVLVVLILAEDKNGSGGFFATLQSDLQQLGSSGGTSLGSSPVQSLAPLTSDSAFYSNDPSNPASAFYVPPTGTYQNDLGQVVPKP